MARSYKHAWRVGMLIAFCLVSLSKPVLAGHFPAIPQDFKTPGAASYIGTTFTINGKVAQPGDEVAFFDPQNVLCGLFIVTESTIPGTYGSVAVYGDDPRTPVDEGAQSGDILTVKIWDASEAMELGGSALKLSAGSPQGNYVSSHIPPIWSSMTDYILNIEAAYSNTNLANATEALKVLSNTADQTMNQDADINGDRKIGLAEVIYLLQQAAALR